MEALTANGMLRDPESERVTTQRAPLTNLTPAGPLEGPHTKSVHALAILRQPCQPRPVELQFLIGWNSVP